MDGIIMAAQLILGLSILVTLHELGHFLPAKLFKTKVDKFYLFFDFLFPRQDLLNFSLFKFKKGETEYGIGWFPLGGYVKIDGMIDESMDKDFLKSEPKPWEFRSKPAWQRLIIMIGGVTVNVITGVFIFIALTYSQGERYLPAKEVKYGIVAYDLAQEMGLKTGDKIVKVNGKEFEKFNEVLSPDVILGDNSSYTVDRNGKILEISIPKDFADKITDKKNQTGFIEPIYPFKVERVLEGSQAAKAGLQQGDIILAIDSVKTPFFHSLQTALKDRKNKDITISIQRGDATITANAKVSEEGKLGFQPALLLKDSTEKYGLLKSAQLGTVQAFTIVALQLKGFGKIFSGDIKLTNALSGPIGMAQQFGSSWNWVRFWTLTGLLSMVLAFMNLLPIPALDGGHVIFLVYEIVTGRKPSDKFLEISQRIGMMLLMGLMFFAIFNDLFKLFN
jgi:regulator of sigma E protease